MEIPPAPPPQAPIRSPWSQMALAFALLAFMLSLPILWVRMVDSGSATTMVSEVVTAVGEAIKQQSNAPTWYKNVRAASILCAFLASVLATLALILKERGSRVAIAFVLALASLLVTAPWLSLLLIGAIVAIAVLLISIGVF